MDHGLLPKRIATQKILAQIHNRIVQSLAGVARFETQFARGFVAVEVPEILGHLDRTRFDGRGKVPLLEKRIDYPRAGDHQF